MGTWLCTQVCTTYNLHSFSCQLALCSSQSQLCTLMCTIMLSCWWMIGPISTVTHFAETADMGLLPPFWPFDDEGLD